MVAPLLWSMGSRALGLQQLQNVDSTFAVPRLQSTGSIVVALGLSCPVACGIFLDQGSNPCLLNQQVDSLPQNHQGSPPWYYYDVSFHYLYFGTIPVYGTIPKYLCIFPDFIWSASNISHLCIFADDLMIMDIPFLEAFSKLLPLIYADFLIKAFSLPLHMSKCFFSPLFISIVNSNSCFLMWYPLHSFDSVSFFISSPLHCMCYGVI